METNALRAFYKATHVEPEYMVVTVRGLKLFAENPRLKLHVKAPAVDFLRLHPRLNSQDQVMISRHGMELL